MAPETPRSSPLALGSGPLALGSGVFALGSRPLVGFPCREPRAWRVSSRAAAHTAATAPSPHTTEKARSPTKSHVRYPRPRRMR
jgi:hypothetical protein